MLVRGFTRFYVESPSISLQAYVSDVFHQKPDFDIGKIGAET
jgi:hypothetical protein